MTIGSKVNTTDKSPSSDKGQSVALENSRKQLITLQLTQEAEVPGVKGQVVIIVTINVSFYSLVFIIKVLQV